MKPVMTVLYRSLTPVGIQKTPSSASLTVVRTEAVVEKSSLTKTSTTVSTVFEKFFGKSGKTGTGR